MVCSSVVVREQDEDNYRLCSATWWRRYLARNEHAFSLTKDVLTQTSNDPFKQQPDEKEHKEDRPVDAPLPLKGLGLQTSALSPKLYRLGPRKCTLTVSEFTGKGLCKLKEMCGVGLAL